MISVRAGPAPGSSGAIWRALTASSRTSRIRRPHDLGPPERRAFAQVSGKSVDADRAQQPGEHRAGIAVGTQLDVELAVREPLGQLVREPHGQRGFPHPRHPFEQHDRLGRVPQQREFGVAAGEAGDVPGSSRRAGAGPDSARR